MIKLPKSSEMDNLHFDKTYKNPLVCDIYKGVNCRDVIVSKVRGPDKTWVAPIKI